MILPLAEDGGLAAPRRGRIDPPGRSAVMELLMEEEVRELVGNVASRSRVGRPAGGAESAATAW